MQAKLTKVDAMVTTFFSEAFTTAKRFTGKYATDMHSYRRDLRRAAWSYVVAFKVLGMHVERFTVCRLLRS